MKKTRSSPGRFLLFALVIFFAGAFARPVVLEGLDNRLYIYAAAVSGVLLFCGIRPVSRLLAQDRILLVVSLGLCAFSILVSAQADMEEAQAQAFRCAGALVLMIAGSAFVRAVRPSGMLALFPAVPALTLLVLSLIMDTGFRAGPVSVVLLMPAFAILLSSRRQLPAMLLALAGTVLLLAQRDLVSAAVWSVTFLLLFWACSGHPAVLLAGAAFVVLSGFAAGLLDPGLFAPEEAASVFLDINPGWVGLELSDPFLSEAVFGNSSMFSWLALRYGWIFAVCVLLFYPVLMLRGSALARASGSRLNGLLAMGAVLLTGLTAIAALLSDFGIWPVSGLSLPGLAGDFPSQGSFLFLMGLCGGVSVRNRTDLEDDMRIAMLAD